MMSLPSAFIAILLAFVGGVYIGNVSARRSGEPGDEIAADHRLELLVGLCACVVPS